MFDVVLKTLDFAGLVGALRRLDPRRESEAARGIWPETVPPGDGTRS